MAEIARGIGKAGVTYFISAPTSNYLFELVITKTVKMWYNIISESR